MPARCMSLSKRALRTAERRATVFVADPCHLLSSPKQAANTAAKDWAKLQAHCLAKAHFLWASHAFVKSGAMSCEGNVYSAGMPAIKDAQCKQASSLPPATNSQRPGARSGGDHALQGQPPYLAGTTFEKTSAMTFFADSRLLACKRTLQSTKCKMALQTTSSKSAPATPRALACLRLFPQSSGDAPNRLQNSMNPFDCHLSLYQRRQYTHCPSSKAPATSRTWKSTEDRPLATGGGRSRPSYTESPTGPRSAPTEHTMRRTCPNLGHGRPEALVPTNDSGLKSRLLAEATLLRKLGDVSPSNALCPAPATVGTALESAPYARGQDGARGEGR